MTTVPQASRHLNFDNHYLEGAPVSIGDNSCIVPSTIQSVRAPVAEIAQTLWETFVELPANANLGNTGVTTVVNSQNQQHMLMKEGRKNILQGHGRVQAAPKGTDSQAGHELILGW
ncbi:hypothetical protein ACET3Z_013722 [Daucus carota]